MIMSEIYFAEQMCDMSRHLLGRNGVLSQVPRQSRLELCGNVICGANYSLLYDRNKEQPRIWGPAASSSESVG